MNRNRYWKRMTALERISKVMDWMTIVSTAIVMLGILYIIVVIATV